MAVAFWVIDAQLAVLLTDEAGPSDVLIFRVVATALTMMAGAEGRLSKEGPTLHTNAIS